MAELVAKYRPDRLVLELAETGRLTDARALFDQPNSGFRVEHIIFVLNGNDFTRRWALSREFMVRQFRDSRAVWLNGVEEAGAAEILAAIHTAAPRCSVFRNLDGLEELYRASRVFTELGLPGNTGARRPAGSMTLFSTGDHGQT